MQRKPEIEELPLDRFEDAYDMLDFVYQKLDDAIYLWVAWSKAFGAEDEQAALRAILQEIVAQESESLSQRMTVEIKEYKDGSPLINAISRRI
jgi:hypothetical protein